MNHQLFFCSLGGFDTHFNQVNNGSPPTGTQANLLAQIDGAMKAFYDATVALGVASQVVTFTLSDFFTNLCTEWKSRNRPRLGDRIISLWEVR
jgi:uncharacterized protein (DUF1501 family)